MHRLVACVACLAMFAPGLVPALELGAIKARSALYEPLDARIDLHDIQSGDIEGLKVALGSPAQFELAGVARLQGLSLLEFTVVEQSDGRSYIHVWTDEPLVEPSLTFLVDVDWPRGRTVRGYKLRLIPAAGGATGTSTSTRTALEVQREPETDATVSPPTSPPLASSSATYGPVRASDTLWAIAVRFRSDDSVSVQRMMLALLEANPEAFVIRNVNALNAGATLRIPTRDEFGPDDRSAVIAEVRRQHSAWKQYREDRRAAPSPSTPVPPSDPEPEPSGRLEVVSPETSMNLAGRMEDGDTQALRNKLALAMEESDAGRRESNELKLRLAEAEDHIRELSRLVDLKNEEIAALQTELRAMTETEPKPVPAEAAPTPTEAEAEAEAGADGGRDGGGSGADGVRDGGCSGADGVRDGGSSGADGVRGRDGGCSDADGVRGGGGPCADGGGTEAGPDAGGSGVGPCCGTSGAEVRTVRSRRLAGQPCIPGRRRRTAPDTAWRCGLAPSPQRLD